MTFLSHLRSVEKGALQDVSLKFIRSQLGVFRRLLDPLPLKNFTPFLTSIPASAPGVELFQTPKLFNLLTFIICMRGVLVIKKKHTKTRINSLMDIKGNSKCVTYDLISALLLIQSK